MALPKIDVPLYELNLVSTGEKIQYRPFLVREKKILMVASEANDPNAAYLAIKQIVNNCTFEKIDVENMALFDLQYLFMKIRSKSIGETAQFKFVCPKCSSDIVNSINFDEIKIKTDPQHNKKIMITDKIGIMMRYPNMQIERIMNDTKREDMDMKIIVNCIDYVFDADNIYYAKDTDPKELENLVESLTEQKFKMIENFFKTFPKLEHNIDYVCKKCGHTDSHIVRDMYGFFG